MEQQRVDLSDLFGTTAHPDVHGMMQECLEEVPADELADQFRHTLDVLGGFQDVAGHLNRAAFTVLSDARERTEEALRRLEA